MISSCCLIIFWLNLKQSIQLIQEQRTKNGKSKNKKIEKNKQSKKVFWFFYRVWNEKLTRNGLINRHFLSCFLLLARGEIYICDFAHCMKRAQTRSFFWSVFSCIRARKNSVFGHFSRSGYENMCFRFLISFGKKICYCQRDITLHIIWRSDVSSWTITSSRIYQTFVSVFHLSKAGLVNFRFSLKDPKKVHLKNLLKSLVMAF